MSPPEIVESHREPAHPPVISACFGTCPRLAHVTLITQPACPIVTFSHARVELLRPQPIQHLLQTSFAMHDPDCNPIHSPAFVYLFDLPLGQPLAPSNHRQATFSLRGIMPSEDLYQSRLVAGKGIGEDGWQVPMAKAPFGILHQGQGGLVGAVASEQGDPSLALGSHRPMVPLITHLIPLMLGTAFVLCFTKAHCASHSKARGGRSWTCSS